MIRTTLLALLIVIAVAVTGFAVYVRLAPMNPAVWDADPETAERTGKPNDFLVAPGGDRPAIMTDIGPADLYARVETVFGAMPRTTRLAADAEAGQVTFVQRSALMGYPDVINVRVTGVEGGSRLSIWSRSRYGESDLGVNKARVERWIAALGL